MVEALARRYPPDLAESWDAVGLVCGEPERAVRRVLFAVDPVARVVDEAIAWGADLVVTHHPLLLRPVHSVAATSATGVVLTRLVQAGVGLYCAHTNADIANPGVSDALADAVGLSGPRAPLARRPGPPLDTIVTFVPEGDAEALIDALSAAGAGALGDYTRCAWTVSGTGTFTPQHGAHPTIGTVGAAAHVVEARVEMVLPRARRAEVVAALRAAHPYEEPAFDVLELVDVPARPGHDLGLGRVGMLPAPMTLATLAERVAAVLPLGAGGVRVAGDPDLPVRRLAVCGGAGDSLLDAAREVGADAYLTADLRHHPALAAREGVDHAPALLDAGHWSTEWPWLPVAAEALRADLDRLGSTVEVRVSRLCTDPWSGHRPANTQGAPH